MAFILNPDRNVFACMLWNLAKTEKEVVKTFLNLYNKIVSFNNKFGILFGINETSKTFMIQTSDDSFEEISYYTSLTELK